jgi:hypothetical protein
MLYSLVPESVLKKRRTLDAVKAKRAAKAQKDKAHRAKVRQIAFKSAEKYVKEYRQVCELLVTPIQTSSHSSDTIIPHLNSSRSRL